MTIIKIRNGAVTILTEKATIKVWQNLAESARRKAVKTSSFYKYLSITPKSIRGEFKGVGEVEFRRV